jgi:two-component system chemotaxis response regulator CheY
VYDTAMNKWFNLGRADIHPDVNWDYIKPSWNPWFADSSRLVFFSGANLIVASPDGMQRTVLLIDDSPAARSILKLFLRSLDANVVEAERADRALKVLRLTPVDLVITDMNMPGMDGISFVAAARNDPSASVRSVPIILLTATLDAGVKDAALRAGVSGYLLKTAGSEELIRAVHAAADGETALSPAVAKKMVQRTVANASTEPAVEPLTERELQVLRLAAGARAIVRSP